MRRNQSREDRVGKQDRALDRNSDRICIPRLPTSIAESRNDGRAEESAMQRRGGANINSTLGRRLEEREKRRGILRNRYGGESESEAQATETDRTQSAGWRGAHLDGLL
jgi:hypothetical protein